MHCDEALNEFSRLIDREAPSSDHTPFMEHIAHCERCGAMWYELTRADAALLRAFMARRRAAGTVADRVIEQLRNARGRQWRIRSWLVPPAAAAAGFLVAAVLFQPGGKLPRMPAHVPLARLSLATGPTEVRAAPTVPWFGCPTNSNIVAGASVRTLDASRCEIQSNDGTQIRLDVGTVVELPTSRCVRLAEGELYSAVPADGTQFKVELPDAVVQTTRGKFDVTCAPGEASLTVIEGSASVACKSGLHNVDAGQRVRLVGGRIEESSNVIDPLQATAWVNELLLLKGPDNPELTERLNDILAQIGHAKLSYLYEDEIRRLGSRAALPLLRYVASPRSQSDAASRAAATRIAADLADETVIAELIALLADDDPQLRSHAARALQRLTGIAQGQPVQAWQDDPASCQPTREAWQAWWESRTTGRARPANAADRP